MSERAVSTGLRTAFGLALLALAAWSPGCESRQDSNSSPTPPFIEAGDLGDIRERETLRVLVPNIDRNSFLPRRGSPLDSERELIASFARQEAIGIYWVSVDSRSDLIPFLLEGKGDLVAANLTATPDRREQVAFTVPVKLVREQVATRRSDRTINEVADLEGRRVAVRRSSSFWQTLSRLQRFCQGFYRH